MSQLMMFVLAYLCLSVMIGIYAARKVKTSTDYIVAGRSLPLYVTIATVFATWFGSETVLGIPATFLEEGSLAGIVSDPFGAALCLILVGLFLAKPLYRMKLMTIGDFYRQKYGRTVEVLVSLAICVSYLGWVSAQIMALGLVFEVLSAGGISYQTGMVIGMLIVLSYTFFGGMWSVAVTDFIQMIVIVLGLSAIMFIMADKAGGTAVVIDHAVTHNMFDFWPEFNMIMIVGFIGALMTMGFGSIPQQDVFQRVMSARNEKTAQQGTIIGGSIYLIFAFVPIFIALTASLIDPDLFNTLMAEDSQRVLPEIILNHTPIWVQVAFFGALLSAIMSTASGTLLAPSVLFAENIVRDMVPNIQDKQILWLIRFCVVGFAAVILFLAMNSGMSIYDMVKNAYKVTLAGAFVPLVAGIYWKRANTTGAISSIICGVSVWLLCEIFGAGDEGLVPPQLIGFIAAVAGMILGSFFHTDQKKPVKI